MLSVLSNGTLSLAEELSRVRQEGDILRGQSAALAEQLRRRRSIEGYFMESFFRLIDRLKENALKRGVFSGLLCCGGRACQVWRRSQPATRMTAWRWLWRRKVVQLWRHAANISAREALAQRHEEEIASARSEIAKLEQQLSEERERCYRMSQAFSRERLKTEELQEELQTRNDDMNQEVAKFRMSLKDAFQRQFGADEKARQQEARIGELTGDLERTRAELSDLEEESHKVVDDLQRSEERAATFERQLKMVTGELSLVDGIVGQLSGARDKGIQRFFEKYNMPVVIVALFRKVLDLQHRLREGLGEPSGRPKSHVEQEIRRRMILNPEGLVSRSDLEAYIHGLRLCPAEPGMVTQVILGIVGLDLGSETCHADRFCALLGAPPPLAILTLGSGVWNLEVGSTSGGISAYGGRRTLNAAKRAQHRRHTVQQGIGLPGYPDQLPGFAEGDKEACDNMRLPVRKRRSSSTN